MSFWMRQARLMLVILLVLLAFPGVLKTPAKLTSMYKDFWARRDWLWHEWQTELAGEAVLAPKVQMMLALLRDNQLQSFRYSDAIANDEDTSMAQRIAESAFPIRLMQDSPNLLVLTSESLDPRCRIVARENEVALASCT